MTTPTRDAGGTDRPDATASGRPDGAPADRSDGASAALAPLHEAFAEVRRRRGPAGLSGLAPGLVVPDPTGWVSAAELLDPDGSGLDDLLAAARAWWRATPHAAAALAFRMYTYWLAMPPVLGWATASRVPLLDPADVLLRYPGEEQFMTVGFRRLRFGVLAGDPVAGQHPDVHVVPGPTELLRLLRETMRTTHLDPLVDALADRVRLGTRTLLGSLASAVAYAVVRGLSTPAETTVATAHTVLSALDVADLVTVAPSADGSGATVRRHTCCLAFTLPKPKLCSGCPLPKLPTRG